MSVVDKNCNVCPEYGKKCRGKAEDCICRRCPRSLGKCLITRYCTETESILN
ncbi:hypothetical protein [Clostridium sp. JS66]|uniref:hypothetical protein n=1 Tax=Clostridium sp. JS66 TaxID=3064705 RepID=UPI00298D8799|nr:hypothetical protein [Clostridium sp. JS66]WPC41957.1 hypothetical protein Q6H37_00235 [Clostridium sp. JS66]